jgi:hypothetical protein
MAIRRGSASLWPAIRQLGAACPAAGPSFLAFSRARGRAAGAAAAAASSIRVLSSIAVPSFDSTCRRETRVQLWLMKTPYLAHCKLTFTTLRPALCSASLRHLHKSPHGVPRAILVLPLPSDRRDARAVVDGHRSTHRVWVVAALRLPPGQKQLSSSSSAAAASRTAQSLETAARAVGRLQVDTVAVEDSHREPLVAFCPAAADFFGQRRCNRSRSRWRWG